jgi:hypothetical protein
MSEAGLLVVPSPAGAGGGQRDPWDLEAPAAWRPGADPILGWTHQ